MVIDERTAEPAISRGYTAGMKTAVSVPNDLFAEVERMARRSGRSRSEVYSTALREYVARHEPDQITEELDRVIDDIGGPAADGAFADVAARRVLGSVEWSISQGDIWWADLAEPAGSQPGFRRPVVVVQGDAFNRSTISTVVCVPLTSNLRWADAPGNVLLTARMTRLPRDSVANVSQVVTLDRNTVTERVGALSEAKLHLVLAGIDIVLGRS